MWLRFPVPLKSGPTCARKAAEDLAKLLQDAGCEVISLGSVNHPDLAAAAGRKTAEHHLHAVAFASASWFEDYLVLDLLEEFPVPVLLWSLPGMETGRPVRHAAVDRLLKTTRSSLLLHLRPAGKWKKFRPGYLVPPGRGPEI